MIFPNVISVNSGKSVYSGDLRVSVIGTDFGGSTGKVFIFNDGGYLELSVSAWADTEIAVNMPNDVDTGDYKVIVVRADAIDSYVLDLKGRTYIQTDARWNKNAIDPSFRFEIFNNLMSRIEGALIGQYEYDGERELLIFAEADKHLRVHLGGTTHKFIYSSYFEDTAFWKIEYLHSISKLRLFKNGALMQEINASIGAYSSDAKITLGGTTVAGVNRFDEGIWAHTVFTVGIESTPEMLINLPLNDNSQLVIANQIDNPQVDIVGSEHEWRELFSQYYLFAGGGAFVETARRWNPDAADPSFRIRFYADSLRDGTIISQGADAENDNREMQIFYQGSSFTIRLCGSSTALTPLRRSGYFAFVFNGTDSVDYYENDQIILSRAITLGANRNPTIPMRLFARDDGNGGAGYTYHGGLSEFTFDIELNTSEQNVLDMPLNDNSSTIVDYSPLAQNGVLNGSGHRWVLRPSITGIELNNDHLIYDGAVWDTGSFEPFVFEAFFNPFELEDVCFIRQVQTFDDITELFIGVEAGFLKIELGGSDLLDGATEMDFQATGMGLWRFEVDQLYAQISIYFYDQLVFTKDSINSSGGFFVKAGDYLKTYLFEGGETSLVSQIAFYKTAEYTNELSKTLGLPVGIDEGNSSLSTDHPLTAHIVQLDGEPIHWVENYNYLLEHRDLFEFYELNQINLLQAQPFTPHITQSKERLAGWGQLKCLVADFFYRYYEPKLDRLKRLVSLSKQDIQDLDYQITELGALFDHESSLADEDKALAVIYRLDEIHKKNTKFPIHTALGREFPEMDGLEWLPLYAPIDMATYPYGTDFRTEQEIINSGGDLNDWFLTSRGVIQANLVDVFKTQYTREQFVERLREKVEFMIPLHVVYDGERLYLIYELSVTEVIRFAGRSFQRDYQLEDILQQSEQSATLLRQAALEKPVFTRDQVIYFDEHPIDAFSLDSTFTDFGE